MGGVDVAVSHFQGTDRAPRAHAPPGAAGPVVPYYERIDQTAIEVQWLHGSWIVKLEALRRAGGDEASGAIAGGVEYAFADYLSVFAEYVADDRPGFMSVTLDREAFVGARLLTQDWTLTLRGFGDPTRERALVDMTATRRLGSATTVTLDSRAVLGDPANEPLYSLQLDPYLELRVARFF